MNKFNKIKKCMACGLLAAIIVTDWGVFCKKCLKQMYEHPHLSHGFFYDFPENIYNPGIESTTTATVNSRTPTDRLHDFYEME